MPIMGFSTHLVGGCIELKWNGGDSYTITAKVIRDCENGNTNAYFDNTISIGIFEKNTHIKKTQFSLAFSTINDDTLKFTGDNCANIVTGCTHIATYKSNITLNSNTYNSNNGYYLSWQRCCRNGIIENILRPGDAAMTLYTELPNLKVVKNSTPRYTSNPNTLLCVNNLFLYNMNFVDDDGDELRYSLIEPLNGNLDKNNPSSGTATAGPYSTTIWKNGYGNNNAILGDVPLSIDGSSGLISCNPSTPGVYVASIRVEEFRFGSKIGEVRLELQLTVTICPNNPPIASVTTINDMLLTTDSVTITIPDRVCFKIRGFDPSDSVYMRITMDSLDSSFVSRPVFDSVANGYKSVETNICWQSACELEGLKKAIPFRVYVYDNGCPISRNATSTFWIKFNPMPLVNSTDLLCMNLVNNKETYIYYGDSTDPANPYFDKYFVYRGVDFKNYKVIDTIYQKGLRIYHDANAPNYNVVNYTYFMVGVNKCGNPGPPSDTLSTFEQLEALPKKQVLKYVTVVENSRIEIAWPQTPEKDFAKYYLYKGIRGKTTYDLIATLEEPNEISFTDSKVSVADTSYCYYLVMRDTCDNIGPNGLLACSMVLQGKSADFISRINWQNYPGWAGGVEQYKIFRADPANDFRQLEKSDSILKYADSKLNLNEGLFYYYIEAKERFNESASPYFDAVSQSNTIMLYQSPIVYTPNAFTANGDGLNDQFKWVPVFVKDFNIQIYNRWGEKVYETNNKNEPWDGKLNAEICQADVYFYRLRYTGYDGSDNTQSGNFTLLR
jgi:gliding motility-associated-like protein